VSNIDHSDKFAVRLVYQVVEFLHALLGYLGAGVAQSSHTVSL